MGDSILAGNNGPIFETGGDMMAEIAIYRGNYVHVFWDACYTAQQIDC